MKKDQNRQARRQGALDRFTIDGERAKKDPEYKQRKEAELASLERSLNVVPMSEINAEVKAARAAKRASGVS